MLLDLRYYNGTNTPAYDPVGNFLNIYDYKIGSPQTLTFGYDDLYRLLTASATGGTEGTYSETYTYDPNTGNLASKLRAGSTVAAIMHTPSQPPEMETRTITMIMATRSPG